MSGILQEFISGGVHTAKCADVVFSPPFGTTPITVSVSTSTAGAHIFYAGSSDGSIYPTHTGDSAGIHTNRIGSNAGSITAGGGTHIYNAIAYNPSFLDSDVTTGSYSPGGGM